MDLVAYRPSDKPSNQPGRWLRAIAIAAVVVAALAVAPVGAQQAGQASRYYEDALSRFEKSDFGGAVVQLKNALQQDPKMLAAYLLLGKAELARGDAAAAEDAFARALQLGVDRSEIAVPMAQALYEQGKLEAVLERFPAEGLSTPQRVRLLVLRGHAYKGLGNLAAAEQSFVEARKLDPKFVPALISSAELAAQSGKGQEALRLAEEAIAVAPTDAALWNLKGMLTLASGDVASALAAYDKALSLSPKFTDARIARASLLIDLNRLGEADADIKALGKVEADPRALYIRAVYLSKRGDDAGTRAILQEIARLVDPVSKDTLRTRFPQLLLIGGLANYGLNQQEQARAYFVEYLRVDPGHVGASKLLGSVLVSRGDHRGAISVLEPALKRAPGDADLLALLAAAHMGRRQYQTATDYLDRALKASGGAPQVHATLGFGLLASGQQELGVQHIRRAFEQDPGQPRAGVALAVLHLKKGQAADAVKVAEAIVKREPDNVLAQNLLGVAYVAAGDRKHARAAYERAIALDKSILAAQLNLARLDLAEGKPDAARARLQAVLVNRPKNVQTMVELATVEDRSGRASDAIRWLEKARALERGNVRARAQLVDLYIATKAPEKALEIAKEGEAVAPEDLTTLAALARAYLALGNAQAAQTTLARMTRLAAFDAGALTQIAQYQFAANDLKGAAYSLDKALASNPDLLPAQVLLTEVELRSGEADAAARRAKSIATRHPSIAVGYRLAGDVAMARARYGDAIQAYRTALAKEATLDNVLRLYRAHVGAGKIDQATEVLGSWLKQHPDEGFAMRALADGYYQAGNLAAARTWYERAIKTIGEDPAILNNLANVLARQGDPQALTHAERAHQLAPKEAAIQDTLGWLLVQRGEVETGLRHLREARLRDPQNGEIRYHLAAALAKTGRTEEARRELEDALRDSASFYGVADARVLLRQLSAK